MFQVFQVQVSAFYNNNRMFISTSDKKITTIPSKLRLLAPKCDRSEYTKQYSREKIHRLTLRQVNVITIRILKPTVSAIRSVLLRGCILMKD